MKYTRKNIQIEAEQAEALRTLAYESRISESEHIRRALQEYISKQKGGKK
jgi:predicted transcriptional regulator